MPRDLTRIGEKARAEPKTCFTSIYHLVKEVDLLRARYQQAKKGKAPGVDGVTKQEYGRNLESNLEDLSEKTGPDGLPSEARLAPVDPRSPDPETREPEEAAVRAA